MSSAKTKTRPAPAKDQPATPKAPRKRKPKIKVSYYRLGEAFSGFPNRKGEHQLVIDPEKREADEIAELRLLADELADPPLGVITST